MESDSTAPAASRTDDEDMTSSRNSAMNEHKWKDMFGSSDAFFSEVEAELEDCMDEANLLEEDAYDKSTKLLHCMVCNETFRSRQGLLSHRLSHGDTEQDPEQQIERPITVSAMVARTSDYADDVENATEDNMLITEEDWCNNGAGPLESFCEHTIISSSSEMSDIICEISLSSRRENEESRSLTSSKFLSNAAIEGILEIIRISATASDEISSLLPKTADSFWNVFEKLSIKGSFIKKLQICEQEITVGLPFKPSVLKFISGREAVERILNIPHLLQYMNLVPDFEANQKGFYGELWTGTWFANSYLAVKSQYGNDAFLIPLLFGTDDANVGGTTSAKPVILSLGIYPIEVRRTRLAVECIAYIPQVNGTKAQKQSTGHARASRSLNLQCWKVLLDSFEIETPLVWIRPYDKKKFTFILKPFMWNVDTVEAYKITNTKSTQSSYPCRICLVHKDNLTSNVLGKLRSPEDFQEKKDAFNPAISSQTYGYHFDNVSDYAIKLDLPKGIYLACVPDPLHVYLVGLVKHLHFWLVASIINKGFFDARTRDKLDINDIISNSTNSDRARLHDFDMLFKTLGPFSTRDKKTAKLKAFAGFTNDVSGLTFLQGSHYKVLVQVTPCLLANSGDKFMNETNLIHFLKVYRSLHRVIFLTTKVKVWSGPVREEFVEEYDQFVGLINNESFRKLNKSEMDFIKVHLPRHFPKCSEAYGSPSNFDVEFAEQLHKENAYGAYKRTNKNPNFLHFMLRNNYRRRCAEILKSIVEPQIENRVNLESLSPVGKLLSFEDSHQFHGLQPAFTKQVLIIHALNLRANYMDKEKVIQTRELIRRGHFKEFYFSKFCNLLNNDRVVASKRYLRNGSDRFDFVEVVFGDEVYLGKVRAIMVCFESIFLIINDFVYASSNARKVHPDVDIPYFKLDTDCSYDGTKFSVIETKDVKSLVHVIECPHKPNYFFWNKDVLL